MIANAIMGALGAIIKPVTTIVDGWQKRKTAKLENQIRLAEAVTTAKIDRVKTKQESDIAWENTALEKAGIKDEVVMIVILTPMIACFVPGGAPYVREGFMAMKESLPDYWIWAFYAVISVSLGVRKFIDFMGFKKGA